MYQQTTQGCIPTNRVVKGDVTGAGVYCKSIIAGDIPRQIHRASGFACVEDHICNQCNIRLLDLYICIIGIFYVRPKRGFNICPDRDVTDTIEEDVAL